MKYANDCKEMVNKNQTRQELHNIIVSITRCAAEGDDIDTDEIIDKIIKIASNKDSGKKFYTRDEIFKEFNSLSEKDKLEIMWVALDVKDLYNGRTHFSCIALAMGYDNNECADNTYFKTIKN